MKDTVEYNSKAWDRQVETGNEWTIPVTHKTIERARKGQWNIFLTPTKPVPKNWFPELKGLKVLCLASGGGQQGSILAAVGALVTIFDNSKKQLEQDHYVAEREQLYIETAKGDMSELGVFSDESFDFIVHPISNVFVSNILPVWREAFRVLKCEGTLISGIVNPLIYIFDQELYEKGCLKVVNSIPYSDLENKSKERIIQGGQPLEFGHTLEDQIKGQIDAGFVITGFYEDNSGGRETIDKYINPFIATKADKINMQTGVTRVVKQERFTLM